MWKTLLNALEASNIMELQSIANFLKARLHGMCDVMKHTLRLAHTGLSLSMCEPPNHSGLFKNVMKHTGMHGYFM